MGMYMPVFFVFTLDFWMTIEDITKISIKSKFWEKNCENQHSALVRRWFVRYSLVWWLVGSFCNYVDLILHFLWLYLPWPRLFYHEHGKNISKQKLSSHNFSKTNEFVFLSWWLKNTWNLKSKFKFQVFASLQDRKTNWTPFLGEVTAR